MNNNNKNLQKAKEKKDDEFYTLYEDIEKEVINYKDYLKDKVIYLNCDNPSFSKFWEYFITNFNTYKLKKVISTYYNKNGSSYKEEYNGTEFTKTKLEGDGDFRSEECIEILKEADVVITNPPFSLFKDYLDVLLENNKIFLFVMNTNSIVLNNIYPYIIKGEIKVGYNQLKKFYTEVNQDKKDYKAVNALWISNIHIKREYKDLELTKKYNEEDYKFYEDFNVLNVDKVSDIPYDYFEAMAVPISYIFKYNPNQFEILDARDFLKEGRKSQDSAALRGFIDGKKKYVRIVIKRKSKKEV